MPKRCETKKPCGQKDMHRARHEKVRPGVNEEASEILSV